MQLLQVCTSPTNKLKTIVYLLSSIVNLCDRATIFVTDTRRLSLRQKTNRSFQFVCSRDENLAYLRVHEMQT